jgi:hypothetical protein
MQNLEIRFEEAMKEIRKTGVKARRNVPGCCSGCIDLGVAEDTAILWHFGGQGNHFKIEGDEAYYYYSSNFKTFNEIYFNHNGLTDQDGITKEGIAVLNIFGKHGIVVDWDGSSFKCLVIDVAASTRKLVAA